MPKYYTRVCNFSFGKTASEKIKNKKSLPLHGNQLVSFESIELLSKTSKKIISINQINNLKAEIKKKVKKDIKVIVKKKKFKGLNLNNPPILMGVLNLTPDSFSDGGLYNNIQNGYKHVKRLLSEGCEIIDVGGESTRPGSKEIKQETEWKRISGVLRKIKKLNKFISIDTRKSMVMKKSLDYKINLINDVSGLSHDSKTINLLKKSNCPFVIHHMKGAPEYMQKNPKYKNVLLEIYDFFEKKIEYLRKIGIHHDNIILDPGIGFGKDLKHNITILHNISIFHSLGFPVMLGISRKKFIKDISGINDSKKRLGGTISSSLSAMMQGVQILRVHDANEIKQAIKVFKSLN
tara:strand:+ start:3637 stop:4683 length:1047 start_codon:yes stop_codon:yes gene_type:complete